MTAHPTISLDDLPIGVGPGKIPDSLMLAALGLGGGQSNVALLDSVRGDDATAALGTARPFRTMQAAVNAVVTDHTASLDPYHTGYLIVPAPYTVYDEDVSIDATGGLHLQIAGFGGWMLGAFGGVNWSPSNGRSITITGATYAGGAGIDVRPSVVLGSLSAAPYMGTNHLALYGPRIAGQIKLVLPNPTPSPPGGNLELVINGVVFGNTFSECIDSGGNNPIVTVELINARFFKGTGSIAGSTTGNANFGANSNILQAFRSRFDGLLTCNTWATFDSCRFDAGFSGGALATFFPRGIFNSYLKGAFTRTAGASNFRLDLASNTTFVENGATLAGGWVKELMNNST